MNCPKCKAIMKPLVVEGVEVDRCTACHGLWFDNLEDQRLRKLSVAMQIDTGDAKVGAKMDDMSHIHCPRHPETLMTHLQIVDQPHIKIESCPFCYGTFFDAGEFVDFSHISVAEMIRNFLR